MVGKGYPQIFVRIEININVTLWYGGKERITKNGGEGDLKKERVTTTGARAGWVGETGQGGNLV